MSVPKNVSEFKTMWPLQFDHLHFELLPEHMQNGYAEYVLFGQPMGHFGTATLEDRLVHSFMHADETNKAMMETTVSWLYNHCPSDARGKENVHDWIQMGGLVGSMEEEDGTQPDAND